MKYGFKGKLEREILSNYGEIRRHEKEISEHESKIRNIENDIKKIENDLENIDNFIFPITGTTTKYNDRNERFTASTVELFGKTYSGNVKFDITDRGIVKELIKNYDRLHESIWEYTTQEVKMFVELYAKNGY